MLAAHRRAHVWVWIAIAIVVLLIGVVGWLARRPALAVVLGGRSMEKTPQPGAAVLHAAPWGTA